jgi:linoleoyl-CoA desaturase
VRALCEKYDLPYTTGPLHRQYGQALRTIIKLSLPNHLTTSDDPAPPERADTANEPPRDRRRRSDDERPPRRVELGAWTRSPSERSHD